MASANFPNGPGTANDRRSDVVNAFPFHGVGVSAETEKDRSI